MVSLLTKSAVALAAGILLIALGVLAAAKDADPAADGVQVGERALQSVAQLAAA
jgi:hypothetical protein